MEAATDSPTPTNNKAIDTSRTVGTHTQLSKSPIHMHKPLHHNQRTEGDSNKEAMIIGMIKDKPPPLVDMVSFESVDTAGQA